MFKNGDKVKLKNTYRGYFESFKGKILTIELVYKPETWLGCAVATIEEFDEMHIIPVKWLEFIYD